jgi:hypothetical protein
MTGMTRSLRGVVALIAAAAPLAAVGCGSTSQPNLHSGSGSVPGAGVSQGGGVPRPVRPLARFSLGIATAAMPSGWTLMNTPDARAMRRQSIQAGDSLDGFLLLPRGADPNNPADDLPLMAIDEALGSDKPPPGQSLADTKQADAAAAARLAPYGFSGFTSLADTTVGGIPASVSEITQTSTGPEGTTIATHRTIGVTYRGQTYHIGLSVRGTSITKADLAALEALRSSWRWR